MEKTIEAEVIELTLESKIETALVKQNVTDAVINELKSRYGNLRLAAIDDKESYLEIKSAAKDCAKLRNLAKRVCTEGREDAVKIQKLWVAKEKEVIAKIAEVESPLDAEIEKYDAEVERKKNEEKQRQEEAYMQRTQALTKIGANYANNSFNLGDFSLEANLVKESSDEVWNEQIVPEFTKEYQKIEAERIEKERIENEKREAERKQREEFERQQAEFKAQQEAFKKQQEEAERAEKERELAEQKQRMELNEKRLQMIMPYNPYNKGISTANLWAATEEEFIKLLSVAKSKHEFEQEEQKRAMEEQVAAKERARIEEEQRLAEIKRQQEEAKKAEELAKAGDKAQWDNFIEQVSNINMPTNFKSGQYRKISAIAKGKIEEILNLKA